MNEQPCIGASLSPASRIRSAEWPGAALPPAQVALPPAKGCSKSRVAEGSSDVSWTFLCHDTLGPECESHGLKIYLSRERSIPGDCLSIALQ